MRVQDCSITATLTVHVNTKAPTLLLLESLVLSRWCSVRPTSLTAASGISASGCSHVSIMKITLQFCTKLFVAICSSNSSIFWVMDLALEWKRLCNACLWGCLWSLASEPDWHPRFCFLYLRLLLHLLGRLVIHGDHCSRAMSSGMLYFWWKLLVTARLYLRPMSIEFCQLNPRLALLDFKNKHQNVELRAATPMRAAILHNFTKLSGLMELPIFLQYVH